jgi:hypothetical protein
VLTGDATHEKPNKRTMIWKLYSAIGQSKKLKRDEGTPRIYVKTSRGFGEKLHPIT